MKYLIPDWKVPKHIKACVTLRHDLEMNYMLDTLKNTLNLPAEPILLNQIHSNIVVQALEENRNAKADALYSDKINQVCAIMTADCLPILFCNNIGTKIAIAHAGWRGLANDIIEETIQRLNEPPENLHIWLGPAIGPNRFEVGSDVYTIFTQKHKQSIQAFTSQGPEKWLANLYELAKIRLKLLGIQTITGGSFCTFNQKELFFSYRRQNPGRMISLIWIENPAAL